MSNSTRHTSSEHTPRELLRDGERAALIQTSQLLQDIGQGLLRFIVQLLPALVRVGCVSICAVGVVYGTHDAWVALGGDGAALIPAFALGLIPLLFAFVNGVKWGGMIAAGAFSYLTAQALGVLPFPLNQLSIVVVLAALTFSDMARRHANIPNEHANE